MFSACQKNWPGKTRKPFFMASFRFSLSLFGTDKDQNKNNKSFFCLLCVSLKSSYNTFSLLYKITFSCLLCYLNSSFSIINHSYIFNKWINSIQHFSFFFSTNFFFSSWWMKKVSKWNQEEEKFQMKGYKKENEKTLTERNDSPIRREGRTPEMFAPARSRRTRRHSRQLTSWRWENKHMSSRTVDVDCWTPTDRPNSPTAESVFV